MTDRIEQGMPLASVPGLSVIGQCSKACADHTRCDFFVFSPRVLPTSYNYHDCLLVKRAKGDMVNEVGKTTGFPGIGDGDCPNIASKKTLFCLNF